MSEILTIDTAAGIIKEDERLEPLSICSDNHQYLTYKIPEYTDKLPNADISKLASLLKFTMKLYNICFINNIKIYFIRPIEYITININIKI